MKAKCVKVYLNPDNLMHCRILDYLEDSKLSDSRALIQAVLDGLRYREELEEKDTFLEEVRRTMQACLREAQGKSDPSEFTVVTEKPAVSPLDFLGALGL